jgi:uncharacterized membrane protein
MAVTARFVADFSDFLSAARSAEGALDKLSASAGLTARSVDKAAKAFSGENLIASAIKATDAVTAIGGASKLTEAEMARVNRTITDAIEKMKLLGIQPPADMLRLADATAVASKNTSTLTSSSSNLTSSFAALSASVATAGASLYAASRIAMDFVNASNAQETATMRLNAALQSQGDFTPALADQYANLASELEKTTGNADELLMEMEALLVQVGNVGPTQMKAALVAASNLSAGLGIDLTTATKAVAKAFDGGGAAIAKMLPSLKDVIKEGATTEEVLNRLNERFGGQAQAQMNTFSGKMKDVANTIDNTKESMGDVIKSGLTPLVNAFQALPQSVQTGVVTLGLLITAAGTVAAAVAAVGAAIAIAAPLFGMSAATLGVASLTALGGAAASAAVAFGPLVIAIGAVWAAWKIGNTETVKNSISEWALSSDNLTAKLSRLVMGIDQMTPAEARAATLAVAAAEAAQQNASAVDVQSDSHKRSGAAFVSYADQLTLTRTQIANLTSEQKAQIKAGNDLGQSNDEIVKGMKALFPTIQLTENAVRLYTEGLKQSDAASKKTAEQQKQLAEFIKKQNDEWSALSSSAFKATGEVSEASDRMAKYIIAGAMLQKKTQTELNDLVSKQTRGRVDYQIEQVNRWAYNELLALETVGAATAAARKDLDALAKLKIDKIIEDDALAQWIIFNNLSTDAKNKVTNLGKAFSNLGATIVGAFQGGGDPFKAIGASLGAGLGEDIGADIAGKFTGKFGKALGSAMGPLGAMAGQLLGAGMSKAMGWIKGLFSDPMKKEIEAANAEMAKLKSAMMEQGGSVEELEARYNAMGLSIREAFGGQGLQGVAALKAAQELFNQRVDESKIKLDEMKGKLSGLQTELKGLIDKAYEMGYVFNEAGMLTGFNFDKVAQVAKEFGVDLAGLGTAFQQAQLTAESQKVIDAFTLMTMAGGSVGVVLNGMKDEINKIVIDSLQFGTTIPDNMKPMIAQLIKQGDLTDKNGDKITDMGNIKFGPKVVTQYEAINTQIETVLTAMNDLISKIDAMVSAIDAAMRPRTLVTTAVYVDPGPPPGFGSVDSGGNRNDRRGGDNADVSGDGFATGTMGRFGRWFANFGAGTKTTLHGNEAVVRADQASAFAADMSGDGGGMASEIAGLRADINSLLPRAIGRAVRDAMQMSGAMA